MTERGEEHQRFTRERVELDEEPTGRLILAVEPGWRARRYLAPPRRAPDEDA